MARSKAAMEERQPKKVLELSCGKTPRKNKISPI